MPLVFPASLAVTLIATHAVLPFFSVPSAQVTVPLACLQVPLLVATLRKVRPAGSWSLTVTPVAVVGPRFLTVRT